MYFFNSVRCEKSKYPPLKVGLKLKHQQYFDYFGSLIFLSDFIEKLLYAYFHAY